MNFVWQPAQIHIRVHLCLAGTSLYQRCLVADEILSAPNKPIHVSAGSEPCNVSVKHWKDCFYNQKKTPHFRTVVFRSERKSTANQRNIIVATLLNPSFTIAWNIYGRNRIKKYIFYKDYTNIRQSKSWLDSFRGLEWKKRMNQEVKCMDSCDSTGRSSICGGRQKMILAQLAMDFR